MPVKPDIVNTILDKTCHSRFPPAFSEASGRCESANCAHQTCGFRIIEMARYRPVLDAPNGFVNGE